MLALRQKKNITFWDAILMLIVAGFFGSNFTDYDKKSKEKQITHQTKIKKMINEKNKKKKLYLKRILTNIILNWSLWQTKRN